MNAQGSPEWIQDRLGKVTASRISDMLAKTKSGWGASRDNYMAELISERLTGTQAEHYINAEMIWGTEHEAEAITAYDFYAGAEIQECGFIPHPRIAMAGASPDRLIGSEGILEVKSPLTKTHIETLIGGSIPKKYTDQMQFQMACTGRQWADFVSYDPRLPERLKLFTRRLKRDDSAIAEMEKQVVQFLDELNLKIGALETLYAKA